MTSKAKLHRLVNKVLAAWFGFIFEEGGTFVSFSVPSYDIRRPRMELLIGSDRSNHTVWGHHRQ